MQAPEPRDIRRDPMAPDAEPTNEELDIVTRAAAESVRERRREAQMWLRQQLAVAMREVGLRTDPKDGRS